MNFHKKLNTIIWILLFYSLNSTGKLFANTKSFEWHPVGVDAYGNITQWINLSSKKPLNNDSFRMQMKLIEGNKQILGRIDINCRNKDYYLRKGKQMSQRGVWSSLIKGTSFEEIAQLYCKNTDAAILWGYTPATKYLWDIEKPRKYLLRLFRQAHPLICFHHQALCHLFQFHNLFLNKLS